jgi:signal transduction histidine kinase
LKSSRAAPRWLPISTFKLESRLSDQVESAAYFVASEALANAVEHSHATEVRIGALLDEGTLTVDVVDDGIGGASTGGGSGLRGLADRIEALEVA